MNRIAVASLRICIDWKSGKIIGRPKRKTTVLKAISEEMELRIEFQIDIPTVGNLLEQNQFRKEYRY